MYIGADISYINEVEDAGAVYSDGGQPEDPFDILARYGFGLARARLWHTPTWTAYSTLDDVKRTFRRARAAGMTLMLDFHYSDTWADPAKQIIPAAWAHLTDPAELARALYDYTLDTLLELHQAGLTPQYVQVGNEINTELLMPGHHDGTPIDWPRNIQLINAGLAAVSEAASRIGRPLRSMLHIAQPEHLMPWFDAATAAGLIGFDDVGLSYYPKWSTCSIGQMAGAMIALRQKFEKPVMVVETAYPWTLDAGLIDDHLLGQDAVVQAYPATPDGQAQFLADLVEAVASASGTGVIYWEPAWVSTPQKPSHWENAALFDYAGSAHKGIEFLSRRVNVPGQE
jgi:arabinogalactan endo-1,4-beta-galactosidase